MSALWFCAGLLGSLASGYIGFRIGRFCAWAECIGIIEKAKAEAEANCPQIL